VTFSQRFVNKFPFTSKLSFLTFLGFTRPIIIIYRGFGTVAAACPGNFGGLRPAPLILPTLTEHKAPLPAPPQKMCNDLPELL
jgi:hypothetical protein